MNFPSYTLSSSKFYRPLLKIHKSPLKIGPATNTRNFVVYNIGNFLPKELRQLTTSGKFFIKDLNSFIQNMKDEKLSDFKQFVKFVTKGMYPSLL